MPGTTAFDSPLQTSNAVWARATGIAVMADMKCEGNGIEAQVAETLSLLPPLLKVVPGAGTESRRRFREADPALPLSLTLDEAFRRTVGGAA